MKTTRTLAIATLLLLSQSAFTQTYQSFETGLSGLLGNCWQFSSSIEMTSADKKYASITGNESMVTLPPVNEGVKDYIVTPYLDLSSGAVTVSFNYMLSSRLAGSAYRLIKIGLVDKQNNITVLDSISLTKTSTAGVVQYRKNFVLGSRVSQKLFVEFSGNTGDGNSRLIFDDLNLSADLQYGPENSCNVAPVAVNDVYMGVVGRTVTGNIKSNDFDPDGEMTAVNVVMNSPDGKLVLSQDGNFLFTPSTSFTGTKTQFFYNLSDSGYTPLSSNTASVTINLAMELLPVNIKSFSGKMENNVMNLEWSLSNNEAAERIELEKSDNGKSFYTCATVSSTGKVNDEHYQYACRTAASLKTAYRLKLVDKNQQVSYSKILFFDPAATALEGIRYISASPGKAIVSFESASTQALQIMVLDINGAMIAKISQQVSRGNNVFNIPLNNRSGSGVYVLRLSSGASQFATTFVSK